VIVLVWQIVNACWSDTVERPCRQLPTDEQADTSNASGGDQALHPSDGESVPAETADDPSSSDHIFNEKYISGRDLPESRRTNSNNTAMPTVACAAFYFVLSAVFHSVIIQSTF